ncbi:uncharacterized protein LOC127869422 [Dreissena polymorpha]|uniref:C2H2-type domain-containing protein n=1 Tax=Dreissena polymorpha TaxID=45954 RepID=A0A9D4RP06_DREPO|nr:uncharacterized protein LOC127869422 [Dreissena polymorpha]KAH3875534.1 hypothetical protein DPMN_038802 [Dreissena polymorpha]
MEVLRESSNHAIMPMSAKRQLPGDQMYPPKKRALFEHKLLHGIENFALNQQKSIPDAGSKHEINARLVEDGMKENTENKENVYFKTMHNFPRQRNDSLQSVHSEISESCESNVTRSREASPVEASGTNFDHRTPERTPSYGITLLRPQLSKPLFRETVEEGALSLQASDTIEQRKYLGCFIEETGAQSYVRTDMANSVKADSLLVGEEIANGTNGLNGQVNIPGIIYAKLAYDKVQAGLEMSTSAYSKSEEARNKTYMGPMVSLLEKFNSVAPNTGTGLSLQMKASVDNMKPVDAVSESKNEVRIMSSNGSSDSLSPPAGSLHESSGLLNCSECLKSFSSLDALRNHQLVHKEKSLACWVCYTKFGSSEKLVSHMKLFHKGVNPYRCQHCSREFSQYNNLRRHLRVHREKLYRCEVCDREFNEEFYLNMHMSTHTGKRVYSCGVCSAGFSSSHELKIHVKSHSPSQLHSCDVCGKSFSKACVLRQHKKGHTGDRPHKCDHCQKTFIHRHHLTMHLRSHTNSKQYTCTVCRKEFAQSSHLYKHLRSHEENKDIGNESENTLPTLSQASLLVGDVEANKRGRSLSMPMMGVESVQQNGSIESLENVNVTVNMPKDALNDREWLVKRPKERIRAKSTYSGQVKNESSTSVKETLPCKRIAGYETKDMETFSTKLTLSENIHRLQSGAVTASQKLPVIGNAFELPSLSKTPTLSTFGPASYSITNAGSTYHVTPAVPSSFPYPMFSNPPAMLGSQKYLDYNQMCQAYNSQVQAYYNHMFMLNYMAQNSGNSGIYPLYPAQGQTKGSDSRSRSLSASQAEVRGFGSVNMELKDFRKKEVTKLSRRDSNEQKIQCSEMSSMNCSNYSLPNSGQPKQVLCYTDNSYVTSESKCVESDSHPRKEQLALPSMLKNEESTTRTEVAQQLLKMSTCQVQATVPSHNCEQRMKNVKDCSSLNEAYNVEHANRIDESDKKMKGVNLIPFENGQKDKVLIEKRLSGKHIVEDKRDGDEVDISVSRMYYYDASLGEGALKIDIDVDTFEQTVDKHDETTKSVQNEMAKTGGEARNKSCEQSQEIQSDTKRKARAIMNDPLKETGKVKTEMGFVEKNASEYSDDNNVKKFVYDSLNEITGSARDEVKCKLKNYGNRSDRQKNTKDVETLKEDTETVLDLSFHKKQAKKITLSPRKDFQNWQTDKVGKYGNSPIKNKMMDERMKENHVLSKKVIERNPRELGILSPSKIMNSRNVKENYVF